jgi:peptidoglycan/xylan/chitin deacetylase (PgdA/CDA1 family)
MWSGSQGMRLVSPLLKRAVYPALHRIGCLGRITPIGDCTVVNYHGVLPDDHLSGDPFLDGNLVRPEVLRRHIQFLKAHFDVIHPEDFRAYVEQGRRLPPRAVLLTCDDGLLNTLTDMLPVLQSESVGCLFFITGASCGMSPGMLWYEELYHLMRVKELTGPNLELPVEAGAESQSPQNFQALWWTTVRRASKLDAKTRASWMSLVRSHCAAAPALASERRWRLLTVVELRQLAESGMSIGAHTLTHPVLALSSDEEARREIQDSKIEIERVLGRPVWAFAYPFGNASTLGQREIRLAREAGFVCAFLNVEPYAEASSVQPPDRFGLYRIHVTSDTGLPEFAAHVSGLHARFQRVAGWLK